MSVEIPYRVLVDGDTSAVDDLVEEGRVILQEREGLRVLVDLTKQDKSEAIAALEEVLSQLKN